MVTITSKSNRPFDREAELKEIRDEVLNFGVWFVPIPRVASKSIRLKLGEKFSDLIAHTGQIKGHGTAKDYIDIIGEDVWEQIFTFGFVRNPWDRLVSSYHLRKHEISFEQYVKSGEWKFLGINMAEYVLNDDNKLLVDFVGRFENLENDIDYVFKKIGYEAKINHLNNSSRNCYAEYYNEETKKIVENHFSRDIEAFEYCFGE